jgi:hypothetical protein
MDYPWRCQGVTHEYWDGPTSKLPKTTCWIEDHNDGGCKSDKFERDARLLEKGLAETPTNERYMFYLAQTYHSLRRFKDCIAMYKKRIAAGGWYEEVWYSHYMIGQSYLSLDDPVRFEVWMQRAYQKNPNRAEPLYKLTKYFRERAQHYKAYYYMQLGKAIPLSTESLFVESDVYTQLFHYEQSILEYYVHPETKLGLRSSMEYMLRGAPLLQGVLYNLKFYAKPLGPVVPRTNLPRPFGETFQPTVISVREYPFANVRYVNYYVENGNFLTRNNETCPNGKCVREFGDGRGCPHDEREHGRSACRRGTDSWTRRHSPVRHSLHGDCPSLLRPSADPTGRLHSCHRIVQQLQALAVSVQPGL